MNDAGGARDYEGVDSLIRLLASHDPAIRNDAALELRELGDAAAVGPLLTAAEKPANANDRGTLIYALQTLDCSSHFARLFDLALTGSYEVQCHALSILENQRMQATSLEVATAREKLEAYSPPGHVSEEDAELLCDELRTILRRLEEGG